MLQAVHQVLFLNLSIEIPTACSDIQLPLEVARASLVAHCMPSAVLLARVLVVAR